MLQALNAPQKKALCACTGAFKSTALSVLEAETYTMPMEQLLLQISLLATTVRILGSPFYRTIRTVTTWLRTYTDAHGTTPAARGQAPAKPWRHPPGRHRIFYPSE